MVWNQDLCGGVPQISLGAMIIYQAQDHRRAYSGMFLRGSVVPFAALFDLRPPEFVPLYESFC